MINLRAKFSEHLRSGRSMIGTWLQVPHPTVVEAMAQTGFDFMLVDGEHAPTPPDVLGGILPCLELHGAASLYRVRSNSADLIKGALDHGVSALMVPMVNSAHEAGKVVEAAKYPPQGKRGFGPWRASNFYYDEADYFASANKDTAIIVQIESRDAIQAVADIARTPGIDALYVGPADLRMSLGLPAGLTSELLAACKRVTDAARKNGIAAGIDVGSLDFVPKYAELGFTLMTFGLDTSYIIEGGRDLSHKAREALKHPI
ncbi:MAG: HpcH/HpaI aldolase/citrate lyase family protein [Rhizobiaceae bacterium]